MGIYLKDTQTLIRIHIYSPVLTAILFTTARVGAAQYPSTDGWLKKLRDTDSVEG